MASAWRVLLPVLALLLSACLPGERSNDPLPDAKATDTAKADTVKTDASGQDATQADGTAGDVTATDATTTDTAQLDSAAADSDAAVAPDGGDGIVVGLGGCATDTDCAGLPYGPCAVGRCELSSGLCTGEPRADGSPCQTDACQSPNATCQSGVCSGPALDCDDGTVCTVDSCDPLLGCVHAPQTGILCSDGVACTVGDTCKGATCSGTPRNCDDGDVCTSDTCNNTSGECNHAPAGSDGQPMACDAGQSGPCFGPAQCVGSLCVAKNLCDDGNPCTFDFCGPAADGKVGCQNLALVGACKPSGIAANDKCTVGECVAAANGKDPPSCVAKPLCSDKPCLPAVCNPSNGVCTFAGPQADGEACDDGNICTEATTCSGGKCKGTPLKCDDGNPCTVNGVCDPLLGCSYTPAASAPCNDGNGCTVDDACSNGKCAGKTPTLPCDDGNPCTTDACDALLGCSHIGIVGCKP